MIFSWLWFAKHVEFSLIFYYIKGLLSFLILYQEKDDRMKSNPDLYFNCATVSFNSLSSLSLSLSVFWVMLVRTSCWRKRVHVTENPKLTPNFGNETLLLLFVRTSCPFCIQSHALLCPITFSINMKSINMLLLAIHCSITHMFCTYMVELLFLGKQISRELWEGP